LNRVLDHNNIAAPTDDLEEHNYNHTDGPVPVSDTALIKTNEI